MTSHAPDTTLDAELFAQPITGTQPERTLRELAYRNNEGLEVALLWDPLTNALTVRVFDIRSGTRFDVAAPADGALDAFDHPFSYPRLRRQGAWRRAAAA